MVETIKQLPPDANSFMANGVKYLLHPSLTVERFKKLEELQIIAGFGSDYQTLYQGITKAYGQINQMKVADASVTLNGVLEGISRKSNGLENPMLLMCTLFIAREGEDLTTWNEAQATDKIKDWNEEGYDVTDFFALAFGFLRRFQGNFGFDSPEFSTPETASQEQPDANQ